MNLLLDVMLNDPDPELGTANQLTNTIRILLDPENMLRSATEKPDFLGFFYRDCMPKLTRFLAQTATGPRQDDYKSAHRLSMIKCIKSSASFSLLSQLKKSISD